MAKAKMRLHDWLKEQPFALTLSSGFFGFFAHCGMLCTLEEQGLLPSRLSGSSAGALVAGAWASGLDTLVLRDRLMTLKRRDFWDPGLGLGFLRGRKFREELRALLPVHRFEDCRAPLAMSLFDVRERATVVVEAGDLAVSIQASCAVPFLFHPVWIEGIPYLDGGISDRPGLAGMPASERVLFHHLASRSPWRRKNSASLQIPRREGLVALVIHGLPRVNPFRLGRGKAAFQVAYEATQQALQQPIVEGAVHIHLDTMLLTS